MLKLNSTKPTSMSTPQARHQSEVARHPKAKPTATKPSEWNCCWLSAVCTMTGMPLANAGQCANAALKTTLRQALRAPNIRKTLDNMDRLENFKKMIQASLTDLR